jgi:hypothetical protein
MILNLLRDNVPNDRQVTVALKIGNKKENYSLTEAMSFIKQTKEKYENQQFARECYKKCVDVLVAINSNNKKLISKWTLTDDALLNRNTARHTENELQQCTKLNAISDRISMNGVSDGHRIIHNQQIESSSS